ncbi:hypothetical protein MUN89_15565 [Halobacillus salinarum]|uniref:Uncharacterized protein n=1 Tax=Halobacillus salinarum TaxID=2932257 RepID=A0ABY4EFT3_9BACI|nr:hypothetical protein [Halobacillus salinarum]UOQ43328.1 hypothetical protein MUN89_15565 [Halobacillus salinarum]
MKNVRLAKVLHLKSESETTFSQGFILIDEANPEQNWNVSLVGVNNIELYKKDKQEGNDTPLRLFDQQGNTYDGLGTVDFIPNGNNVLLVAKGRLNKNVLQEES